MNEARGDLEFIINDSATSSITINRECFDRTLTMIIWFLQNAESVQTTDLKDYQEVAAVCERYLGHIDLLMEQDDIQFFDT